MTLDLLLLALIVFFAVIGSFAGAARQVGQLVALVVAYLCARPLGTFLGPRLARALDAPLLVGTVAATLLVFIVVLVAIRYAVTWFVRRLLAGKDPHDRRWDRRLGFVLGGLKVTLIAYVIVCALTFVEQNVTVMGKKIGVSPKDSQAFALARKFNLFEMTQFSAVQDLVAVARATSDPKQAEKMKDHPAYQALRKDPRFAKAMDQAAMQKAIESGDYQALLRSNVIMQLIQDPAAAAQLAEAAGAAQR